MVESERAGGLFFISGTAEKKMRWFDKAKKARLTTWIVDQRRLGVDCPKIMTNTLDAIEQRPALPVQERADRLLRHLQTRISLIGNTVDVPSYEPHNAMFAWSESVSVSEVTYLLDYLEKSRWVESRWQDGSDETREYTLTPDGYARLAELETKAVDSKQAFVAMWFDKSMEDAYTKGIAPAITDAGYEPLRIDGKEHNNKIDDEIIAEIRRSRFLVADFTQGKTGARGGVYYEAGYASGLNLPVIFTCRADAMGNVHFDTRQYNHITWDSPEELRDRLAKRISATIGDGPLKRKS